MRKTTGRQATKQEEMYRKLLLAKKADVLSSLGIQFDTLAGMGRVGEEDQAQVTHDEFISLHLNSLDYEKLRDVTEALDRLDAGDYGTCLGCDEPIPTKRLDALPWAKYCLTCQQQVGTLMAEEQPMLSTVRGW